jgi:hypothetical protein
MSSLHVVFLMFLVVSNITSMVRIVAMFLIVDSGTIFNRKFLSMCMICLHAKIHVLNSNSLLIVAIKPKAKYRFHAAAILLSYIL